jgi:ATP-dependent exoDNAse (exonuclease V) alpha subunit/predicted SprT family Zn-dependent metalloprotease
MSPEKFKELMARAAAIKEAREREQAEGAAAMIESQMEERKVQDVDLSRMGISSESIKTDEGAEAAVDAIRSVISQSLPEASSLDTDDDGKERSVPGVARDVELNAKQQEFLDAVVEGRSTVLIGAAGTGKTTSMRKTTRALIDGGKLPTLAQGTKWLLSGQPGAVVLSFTNKAVNNIRHAVVDELKAHTITIHKLLEFQPNYYEIEDPDKPGNFKMTMRFEPARNLMNPLPPDLKLVAFEESSMISVELYEQLQEAMPHEHQEIFLGDIQQLPPVFGLAILGFKMLELPVIELTEVYRQALDSPIISLAWKILDGNPHVFSARTEEFTGIHPHLKTPQKRIRVPALEALSCETAAGTVKFQPWQKPLSPGVALNTAVKQFQVYEAEGYYNPTEDIILCPYNKEFGTIELNKGIMQYLGTKRGATVHEIVAGFEKHYYAVGDRVLFEKEDATIVDIARNSNYLGKLPQKASVNLDRWGHMRKELTQEEVQQIQEENSAVTAEQIEALLNSAATTNEDRVQDASHVVVLKTAYGNDEVVLDKASQFNGQNLLGGYAITVHKSQGSEYDRVFLVLHAQHVKMVSRELLYTAVTRAKRHLHIICERDSFYKGTVSQRIKGNTLVEKAEFFKGKESAYDRKRIEERKKEAGEFQAGIYKGNLAATAIAIKESTAPKAKLVRMEELVPQHVKDEALQRLRKHWERARIIWGEKIGGEPQLSFNLQRHRMLGLANFKNKTIKLNPVWCCLVDDDPKIKEEMLHTTLIHEICHIVAGTYSSDYQHGTAWNMAMQLMGLPPNQYYTGDTLPPWMDSYQRLAEQKQQELAEQGGDTSEDYSSEEGDVA